MSFTASIFIFLFFPVFLGGYYFSGLLEQKVSALRKIRLLNLVTVLFSLFFYSFFNLYYLGCIGALIFVTFLFGTAISRAKKRRKLLLALAVCSLAGTLFAFKYLEFCVNSAGALLSADWHFPNIAAPLGISFLTFSAISYVVDVYRGDAPAGSLLDAALFLSFFPKVMMGPIVLWKDFKRFKPSPHIDLFITGMNRLCVGFAKKVVLADTFGSYVSEALANLNLGIDTGSAWIVTLFFFLQLYFDFSGYSDIAIGISAMLGYRLGENFRFPYLSTSITDFWKRWHISLGVWFKEYLYIPLGGSRRSKGRTILNLLIVFLVTGIWHGAGLSYLLWGLMHGVCRIVEQLVRNTKLYLHIPAIVKWAATTFVVMIGWTAFCFGSWHELLSFLYTLFGLNVSEHPGITALYFCNVKAIAVTVIALLGAWLFGAKPIKKLPGKLRKSPVGFIISELFVLAIFVGALIFMINSTYSPFLYARY